MITLSKYHYNGNTYSLNKLDDGSFTLKRGNINLLKAKSLTEIQIGDKIPRIIINELLKKLI